MTINDRTDMMNRNLKTAVIVFLCSLALQSSFGQERSDVRGEEVFVHTDRDVYIAGEQIWFTAYTFDSQSLRSSSESRLVYVELVAPGDKPLLKTRFALQNGYGPGQMSLPDTLSSGLYRLRAYTGWMKNFLPENCFMKDIGIFNAISSKPNRGEAVGRISDQRSDSVNKLKKFAMSVSSITNDISITSPDSVGRRRKVVIGIDPGKGANLSISVSAVGAGHTSRSGSTHQGVTGHILSRTAPTGNGGYAFKFQKETADHYLTGKLIRNDQQPVPEGEAVLLSVPGKVPQFQYALTDKQGYFSFPLPIDQDIKDLVIQPENRSGGYKIEMETSFSDLLSSTGNEVLSGSMAAPENIAEWSSNFQVAKIYGLTSIGGFIEPVRSTTPVKRFYGKPELEVQLKDYISLPLMEEVFFELVPRVILKSDKSVYELYIVDPLRNRLYDGTPVMMIDGVIFDDPSVIGNMDPAIVEKIDVIREIYVVGDYQFPGIVNIITKSTDYRNMALPSNAVRIPYQVAAPVASFRSPEYATDVRRNGRLPDFRNTLYWNPSVKPGNDGKCSVEFYSSDFASDYEILVEGLTGDGRFISQKKILSVK